MTDEISNGINAFIEGRYHDCIAVLKDVAALDYFGRQLLLISLMRTGQVSLARAQSTRMLCDLPPKSLRAHLTMLTVNTPTIHPSKMASLATSPEEESWVHYYVAEWLRTIEQEEEGIRGAYIAAALTEANTPECRLAERLCLCLGEGQKLVERRIYKLTDKAQRLIDCGKGSESIPIWMRALDIAQSFPKFDSAVSGFLQLQLGLRLEEIFEFEDALTYLTRARDILDDRTESNSFQFAVLESSMGRCNLRLKRYANALVHFQIALRSWSQWKGPDAPDTIIALDEIAYTHELMGDLKESQQALDAVVTLKTRVFGPDDPRTRDSMDALANIARTLEQQAQRPDWDIDLDALVQRFRKLLERGDRSGATSVLGHIQAVSLSLPSDHAHEGIQVLTNLHDECHKQGEVQVCLSCMLAASVVASHFLRQNDPVHMSITGNLAEAHREAGNYNEAKRLNEALLDLRRQVWGYNHPDIALTLNNLAQVHLGLGHVSESLSLMASALQIDRDTFGDLHDATAGDLHNIANAHKSLNEFAQARELYWQAIDIWQTLHPDGHAHLAIAFENLGNNYLCLGDATAAELCLKRSRDMNKAIYGASHPKVLRATALVARINGEKASKEIAHMAANAEDVLGKQHPDLLRLRIEASGDAVNPWGRNDLSSAFTAVQRALGNDHSLTMHISEKEIDQSAKMGDFARAKIALQNLIERNATCKDNSPDVGARLKWKLASIEAAIGQFDVALVVTKEAVELFHEAWKCSSLLGSENDLAALVLLGTVLMDHVLSLLTDPLKDSPELLYLALEFVLRYKYLTSSLLELERAAARASTDSDVHDTFVELRQIREKILNELTVGPGSRGAILAEADINKWQLQYRRLSERQTRSLSLFSMAYSADGTLKKIVASLKPDDGLIEYVRFFPRDFSDLTMGRGDLAQRIRRDIMNPDRVVAFLIRPDDSACISWAAIGRHGYLATLIEDLSCFLRAIPTMPQSDYRDWEVTQIPRSWREAAAAIRSAILDPIAGVWNCKRFFIAPDGVIANLPFELLPDALGGVILDERLVSYLSSGRDVLKFADGSNYPTTEPVVFADPAYSYVDTKAIVTAETLNALGIALASPSVEKHIRYYPPLEGALQEGRSVARLLGARLLLHEEANKTNILALRSPRILHLATHAYYPDRPGSDSVVSAALSFDFSLMPRAIKESSSSYTSGLALAGANWKYMLSSNLVHAGDRLSKEGYRLDNKATSSGLDKRKLSLFGRLRDKLETRLSPPVANRISRIRRIQQLANLSISWVLDGPDWRHRAEASKAFLPADSCGNGVITADEVGWLELSGTELVVLSACGTALGIYEEGAGLFGLRRSFIVAGAQRLVCSLWQVPDRPTALLMKTFYKHLVGGSSTAEALQKAKATLKEIYPEEPFYWASFILFGRQEGISQGDHRTDSLPE